MPKNSRPGAGNSRYPREDQVVPKKGSALKITLCPVKKWLKRSFILHRLPGYPKIPPTGFYVG